MPYTYNLDNFPIFSTNLSVAELNSDLDFKNINFLKEIAILIINIL